eukprot:scaffold1377_cov390-Prasinococcus_capsulatus_cf.AAC.6
MLSGPWAIAQVRRDIVAFHAEAVLLENYSTLNYLALVKILKKHDKVPSAWLGVGLSSSLHPCVFGVTGRALKDTILRRVSQQPFWSTDMLERLVKEAQVRAVSDILLALLLEMPDLIYTAEMMLTYVGGVMAKQTVETDIGTKLENRQEGQESLIDVPKLVAGPDSEEVDNALLQRFDSALQAWQRQGFKSGPPTSWLTDRFLSLVEVGLYGSG